MGAAEAAELADQGPLMEVTAFQLLHQPGCTAAGLAEFVRRVRERRVVLASDAGQPDSPPAPESLAHLVDVLEHEGLDRSVLDAMAGEIPERLVTP